MCWVPGSWPNPPPGTTHTPVAFSSSRAYLHGGHLPPLNHHSSTVGLHPHSKPQSHNALCIDEHGGEEEGGVAQRTMCLAPYPRPALLGWQRAAA
jgi:hypothetical protein